MDNRSVTVARDAQPEPSTIASAGCVGDEAEPCSQGHTGSPCPETLRGIPSPKPPQTIRELEHALRGLGYSARQSRLIATRGFKATQADLDDLADKLNELAEKFKGTEQ